MQRASGSLHSSWPLIVQLLKNYIAPYSDQVSFHLSLFSNKSFLEQTPLFSINLGFSFLVLSLGWKVFSSTISILIIFRFSFSVLFSSGWGVFYQLIPRPVFLLNLPIIRFGGFSPATWTFETHQLSYRARIFSMVPRFSFLVSLIGLRGFSPDSYFSSMILHLTELAFKKRGNCNNMTFRAESFWNCQSKSHITTIIQNFILVSLTFTMTPHPVGLPFEAVILSLPMYLTFYALVSLCTHLIITSVYQLEKHST